MKPFQFKQFSISHERSAMKVGTDGVLLGAWANITVAKTILDIGTGTGLLALMCAQRNREAKITAIDISKESIVEATENFKHSPWASRLTANHTSLQDFKSKEQFDHIICNPPYFENNDLQKTNRTIARQFVGLTIKELTHSISNLLDKDGFASLIFPFEGKNDLIERFEVNGLYLQKMTTIYGRIGALPVRAFMQFGFEKKKLIEKELYIELDKRHDYSEEYKTLTKDFYLRF